MIKLIPLLLDPNDPELARTTAARYRGSYASALERETRGFISITTMRPVAGSIAVKFQNASPVVTSMPIDTSTNTPICSIRSTFIPGVSLTTDLAA